MKNKISYILILLTLFGILSPVSHINAQKKEVLPICEYDENNVSTNNPCLDGDTFTLQSQSQVKLAAPTSQKPTDGLYTLLEPLPCDKGTEGCENGQLT